MKSSNFILSKLPNPSQKIVENYFFYSLADLKKNLANSVLSIIFQEYDFLRLGFWQEHLQSLSFVKKAVSPKGSLDSFDKSFRLANHLVLATSSKTINNSSQQKNLSNCQKNRPTNGCLFSWKIEFI